MKEQLLHTWQMHHRMNELVINHTTDAGMLKTLSPRGRPIFQQWIHVHAVRCQWMEVIAKKTAASIPAAAKNAPYHRETLVQLLTASARGLEMIFSDCWDKGGKVTGFRNGLLPLVGYFISHESHHRGNMLLTLKQTGEKIPDALKWGLWEWGK